MKKIATNSIVRRFMILAVMLSGLAGLTFGNAGNAPANKIFLPCCSTCEANPQAPLCEKGCRTEC